jgi:hypothetical protein
VTKILAKRAKNREKLNFVRRKRNVENIEKERKTKRKYFNLIPRNIQISYGFTAKMAE